MIRYTLALIAFLSTTAFSQEQRYGLGTQISLHGGVPVAGAEFVMSAAENMQLNFAYVGGETSLANDLNQRVVNYVTKADFGLSEASVTLRWLLTRSFYVGAGAGYRMMHLDMAGRDFLDDTTFNGTLRSESIQAKLLLGNSWNFSNGFYLAVDWVGFGVPMAITRSEMEATEYDLDQNVRVQLTDDNDQEFKRVSDELGRTTMGTLLTLRLGFNF